MFLYKLHVFTERVNLLRLRRLDNFRFRRILRFTEDDPPGTLNTIHHKVIFT